MPNAGESCNGSSGTITCDGRCAECRPRSRGSCACEPGFCPGRKLCSEDGLWGSCECKKGECPSGWQPEGVNCTVHRVDPGRDLILPDQAELVLLSSPAPTACIGTSACAVRILFGSFPPCPGGALVFRCDANPGSDVSLLVDYVADDPLGGPQFPCQHKLEVLSDHLGASCRVNVEAIEWAGVQLADCPP